MNSLVAGFIFGVIALYLLRGAKREANLHWLIAAIILFAYPFFVSNPFLVWGIGLVTIFYAYVMR